MKLKGYTEYLAIKNGMSREDDLDQNCTHCPECGCPWYANKNLLGEGSRVCCDCEQDWWTDINYENMPSVRELG